MRFIWMWALLILLVLVCYPTAGGPGKDVPNGSFSGKQSRIINGELVPDGIWTSLALLIGIFPTKNLRGVPMDYGQVTCGSAMITNRLVLTAAHCIWNCRRDSDANFQCDILEKTRPGNWRVYVGEVDWSQRENNRHFWNYTDNGVEKIFIHPSWNRKANFSYFDIAVVKTRQSIPERYGRTSMALLPSPAAIPDAGYNGWPPQFDNCMIAGWGCTVAGGPPVERLWSIHSYVAKEDCEHYTYGVDKDLMICAGDKSGHKFTCDNGDSGGPLYCPEPGEGNEWYVAGVLSTGPETPNAKSNLTLYGRTSEFYSWIVNPERETLNPERDEL